jgi:hypothetical protein
MQSVSNAFRAAAIAATQTPVRAVSIALVDNQSMVTSITPIANTFDPVNFAKERAINGIVANPTKWAFADPYNEGAGGRVLADGSWYPFDPLYEGGWKGGLLADNAGNIAYDPSILYDSANQDTDTLLAVPASVTLNIAQGQGTVTNSLGNSAGSNLSQAQTFKPTITGQLSQLTALFGANSGSPVGTVTWYIYTDTSGLPGTLLATGTFTPTPSANNTINITNGPTLQQGLTYWFWLRPTTEPQASSTSWKWMSTNATSVYADGTQERYVANTSAWTALGQDLECSVTVSPGPQKDKLAQNFTTLYDMPMVKARLWLKKVGAPTGTMTLRVETVDGSGNPTGTLAHANATATLAESGLSTSFSWRDFFWAGPWTLPPGTYTLVLSTSRSASATDYTIWGSDHSTPSYSGGVMRYYSGGVWSLEGGVAIFNVVSSTVSGESYTLSYGSPISIATVELWADAFYGIPVDFSIAYDPTGSAGYTTLVAVTNNTASYYKFAVSPSVTCKLLRITITRMQYGQMYPCLLEFQGGLVVDVSSAVEKLDILQERYADNATLVIGNASAGELSLSQENLDGRWSPHNSLSPYAQYLKSNRRIRYQVGFQYADGTTEFVPMGTFYSMRWSAPGGGVTATLKGQDRMKRLRERQYRNCPLLQNTTVDAIIKRALTDAGLGLSEMVLAPSTTVVPYAWIAPSQSFFDYVQALAAVDGGVVFFDENDIFHFQDANYLHNNSTVSVMTITDSNALIASIDEWDEGEIRNRIVVNVNTLKLASSAQLWALQEQISIPAGQSITLTATLQTPATNITTPAFTQSSTHISLASWTAYAQTVVMTFNNSGGAAETLLTVTISGQALQVDGQNVVIAESASVTNGLEAARELLLNNSYVQTKAAATALANNLLAIYANPPSKIRIEMLGQPHLELGDRITVNSAQAGINSDFWIVRHTFSDDGGFSSAIEAVAVF